MRRNNRNKPIVPIVLAVLVLGLVVGLVYGKYAGEWSHFFELIISPTQQENIDTSLRRYFRSNELLPVSEGANYAVNGTDTWFTVANALDSTMVSEDEIKYTLTWYYSADGSTWTQFDKVSDTLNKNTYDKQKYTVAPYTVGDVTYNTIKVVGESSSVKQEKIEAVYTFTYNDYIASISYADGIITVDIDTNDMAGDYIFTWAAGITPDNSDPNCIFTTATVGAGALTAKLTLDTGYRFYFFVTDAQLLSALNAGTYDVADCVKITKN